MTKLLQRPIVVAAVLIFTGLTAGTAWAASIGPGFDFLHTPDGTAGFDLPGGPHVNLMSLPIVGFGNTDTIVQRFNGIDFSVTDPGTTPTQLVALSLMSTAPVNVGGSFFDVFVTINALDLPGMRSAPLLTSGPASTGEMTISSGGTFSSFFDVFAEVDLVGATGGGPSFIDQVGRITGGGTWTTTPPPGYPTFPGMPSGGFYPGPITHTGPHPVVDPATTAPEPATMILLGFGLGAIRIVGKKTRASRCP
jgi:PEP-CTERM motif